MSSVEQTRVCVNSITHIPVLRQMTDLFVNDESVWELSFWSSRQFSPNPRMIQSLQCCKHLGSFACLPGVLHQAHLSALWHRVSSRRTSLSQETKQPVEKVQVIPSFYPWWAKSERKWECDCTSILIHRRLFQQAGRFLTRMEEISLFHQRGCRKKPSHGASLRYFGVGLKKRAREMS